MYKTLYEEALAQLKNNQSQSLKFSMKNLSLHNIDPRKIEKIVEKVKIYVQSDEQTTKLEFDSQEETLIFCETLKVLYRTEKDKIDSKITEVNEKLQEFELLQQEYELIDNALQEMDDSANSNRNNTSGNMDIGMQKLATFGNESVAYTDRDNTSTERRGNLRYSPLDEREEAKPDKPVKSKDFNFYEPSTNDIQQYQSIADKRSSNNQPKTFVPPYTNKQPGSILQSKIDPSIKPVLTETPIVEPPAVKRRNLGDYFLNKEVNDQVITKTGNKNVSPDFIKSRQIDREKPQTSKYDEPRKDPYAKPSFLTNNTTNGYVYGNKK